MKIIILHNSILFLRVKPDTDAVKAYYLFFISWYCFKNNSQEFDLNTIPMAGVKKFYENLSNEWNRKYKI